MGRRMRPGSSVDDLMIAVDRAARRSVPRVPRRSRRHPRPRDRRPSLDDVRRRDRRAGPGLHRADRHRTPEERSSLVKRPTAEDRRLDYLRIGADLVNEFSPVGADGGTRQRQDRRRGRACRGDQGRGVPHLGIAGVVPARPPGPPGREPTARAGTKRPPSSSTNRLGPVRHRRTGCASCATPPSTGSRTTPRTPPGSASTCFAESPEIKALLERSDDDVDRFWIFFESYLRRTGRRLRRDRSPSAACW